jgi:protoporphyrinogen oxidase
MTSERGPFVVIGGGPCGLAAAWELARRGLSPVVLEAEDRVGGLCATHEQAGFRFDLGGHRFVSSDTELSRWLEELLGDDLLEQERRSVVLHQGRRFRYPLEARDLLANLGLRENARALAGYAAARMARSMRSMRGPQPPERSFEEWVVARFGWPLYRAFFGPYTEKLWGRAPQEISADWAAERISLLHLGDALVRLLGVPRPEIRTYARRYRYPRFGMGQLYETMAREVEAHGGVVHLGARVTRLETNEGSGNGDRVTAVVATLRNGHELRVPLGAAGQLLSTMPLTDLARGLGQRSVATERLRFRGLTFLNLGLSRARVSDATWMYVADGSKRISRIQEPKRRSAWMAPPGKTSLMLEIPSDPGDDVWTASDAALEERMRGELRSLGLPLDDVETRFTVRVEHGYPVYHLDYQRDRLDLLAAVGRFANVRTAGRQGLFRYVFMDAAMQMGRAAAVEMAEGARATSSLDLVGGAREHGRGLLETTAITA